MPREAADALRREAARKLKEAGIETADLDARLLLQHATGLAHEDLIADPRREVEAETVRRLINRRLTGEPVGRITGAREFYGRVFRLNEETLEPRPDTETLIDAALALDASLFLDLGTGTGAIAITLLAERPQWRGTATDIAARALAMARENAEVLGVAARLTFHHGSWFDGVSGRFDLIVSNPPYIPLSDIDGLAREVREHDPHRALDGGPDGLEAYRRIAAGASGHLAAGGRVLLEIGAGQAESVANIFKSKGFLEGARHRDLTGRVRVLTFSTPSP